MNENYNDSPIQSFEADQYGIGPFARSLAGSIATINSPVGTTIALFGPWGAGKSSAVNLIKRALTEDPDTNISVSAFRCWWYRGQEALALGFFQQLQSSLELSLGEKGRTLIPSLTQHLLQVGPEFGALISSLSGNHWSATLLSFAARFARPFFPKGQSVETEFAKLTSLLANQARRHLIIIDDIDRLSPDEAIAVFQLVRSVGQLPNVIYLLVFDREIAERALQQRYPSEGGSGYLDKIIQAGFTLPSRRHSPISIERFSLPSIEYVALLRRMRLSDL